MDDGALDLWRLGKQAFYALGEIQSREEFDELHQYYLKVIKGVKIDLAERMITTPKAFAFNNPEGESITPDFDDISNSGIIDILWQFARSQSGDLEYLAGFFLFACMEEIDHAIIGMCIDVNQAVSSTLAATEAYANYQAIKSGNDNLQKMRSEMAYQGAIERHRRDPKQKAKIFVKECWVDWLVKPEKYVTQTAFALDVLEKVDTNDKGEPIISFDTIVKKWIPVWTREIKESKK